MPARGGQKHKAAFHLKQEAALDKRSLIEVHNMLTRVAADKTRLLPPLPLHSTKDKIRATKSNHTAQSPLVEVCGPLRFVRDQGLKA